MTRSRPEPASDRTGRLRAVLDRWGRRRVLVVGDFMLDRCTTGDTDRLAPDAPVPVLRVTHTHDAPGGAGNVCRGLAALGQDVTAVGVVGDDAAGRRLRGLLAAAGTDVHGLATDPARPTTLKHSLRGRVPHRGPQKLLRVDTEDARPLDAGPAAALRAAVAAALPQADLLCVQDHGKGVLDPATCRWLMATARRAGVPVLVDPAGHADFTRYAGADGITPNRAEARRVTGQDGPEAMARALQRRCGVGHVVLTLDRDGTLLLDDAGAVTTLPAAARRVQDVAGAGDTVLATLAAARANDTPWAAAVAMANAAAGVAVGRPGAAAVSRGELRAALGRAGLGVTGGPAAAEHAEAGADLATLGRRLDADRAAGRRVVLTNGCFDVLHAGHVACLHAARDAGDVLVVAVNDDASVRRLKGRSRPVFPLDDRVRVLAALGCVDHVVPFAEDTPLRLIRRLRPDVLVKGGDYRRDQVVGGDEVEAWGGRVLLVPPLPGRSTTDTLSRWRPAGGGRVASTATD